MYIYRHYINKHMCIHYTYRHTHMYIAHTRIYIHVCTHIVYTNTLFLHIYTVTKVKVKLLSRVRLFATPWTVAYQAPPSMGFLRQEYTLTI